MLVKKYSTRPLKSTLQQQWQQCQAQRGSLDSSKNAKQAELETVEAQIEQLRQTLPIVTQRAANYEKLLSTNMVAKDEYLQIEQERITQQQTQQALYAQKRQLQASLQEIDKNSSALKAETLAMAWPKPANTSKPCKKNSPKPPIPMPNKSTMPRSMA
jgi:predicted  nucleic acid-binding Zn-ribbon protein